MRCLYNIQLVKIALSGLAFNRLIESDRLGAWRWPIRAWSVEASSRPDHELAHSITGADKKQSIVVDGKKVDAKSN